MKPQTAAGVGLLVYLSGQDKIKPPTGSGRRERISVHHDELITGVDFFFAVQIFFNIEGVFGVVVGSQLVVGVLGRFAILSVALAALIMAFECCLSGAAVGRRIFSFWGLTFNS